MSGVGERRLVEAGRVCLINYGPLAGKLCVIVNVVDSKVALVDGAGSGVARHLMPLKRLSITKINIKDDIDKAGAALRKVKKDKAKNKKAKPRVSNFKKVEKAFKDADVAGKWAASSWAKGIAKKAAKKGLGDFERFQMMVARKTRAKAVNKAVKAMTKGKK